MLDSLWKHIRIRDAKHHGRNIPLEGKSSSKSRSNKTLFQVWADNLKKKVEFTPASKDTNNRESLKVGYKHAYETLLLFFSKILKIIEEELK